MTVSTQPAIFRAVPPSGRFLTFGLRESLGLVRIWDALSAVPHDEHVVLGFGAPLLGKKGTGLRPFPSDIGLFPSTQAAAWAFLGHADRGAQFDAGRALAKTLAPALSITEEIDAFTYRGNRDLTGFEDGTENPKGDAAVKAVVIRGAGAGLDGGTFVAVQRWVHDLRATEAMAVSTREAIIGRELVSNEEMADAPLSAHVKRTAQESFDPPAFVLRRSMPYGGVLEHGLYFVAYGESLDHFERQLRRMAGQEDGIPDGLLAVSRALTGGYYFCPPLQDGRLDLSVLRG